MIYLTLAELLYVAERTLGHDYAVRDYGLLEAAVARPQATVFGQDAYPDLDAKAAALLHSVARNHALIDGNKRLGLRNARLRTHENGNTETRMLGDLAEIRDALTTVFGIQLPDTDRLDPALGKALRPGAND